jgi:hypothetical protein
MVNRKKRSNRNIEREEIETNMEATATAEFDGKTLSGQQVIDFAIGEHTQQLEPDLDVPYRTPLWNFTRAVKSCFNDTANPDDVFFDLVDVEVERRGGWGILDIGMRPTDIYVEFVSNWEYIRFRIGEEPLTKAQALAIENPLRPPKCERDPRAAEYGVFISLAGWLQFLMGDLPIMLPCEKVALLMGVGTTTVDRYRKWATQDGYLRVIAKHSWARHRATKFLFNVSRFPVLKERIEADRKDTWRGHGDGGEWMES